MPRESLIKRLAERELADLKKLRRQIVIIAVLLAVMASSAIAIPVTLWAWWQAGQDSTARAQFNCNIQRTGRIEGHKRFVYTRAVQVILNERPDLTDEMRAKYPDVFSYPTRSGLPDLTDLPVPDCTKLP